jgi:hypothetical protein
MRKVLLFVLLASVLLGCADDPTVPSGPTASFQVTPLNGSNDTDFVVDASGSRGAEDPPSKLQVRWDWEDDEVWDTEWTFDKIATHRYPTEGSRTIRLEVRDTSGQTDQATRNVEVRLNSAPETVIDGWSTSFSAGYTITIAWSGSDLDGEVAGFLVGWSDSLRFVTASDSVFTLAPTFGDRTFRCAALDAEGRWDPTPATLSVNVPHSFLDSDAAVVDGLEFAYRTRDVDLFTALLANDRGRNAGFLFLLSEPTEEGETQWGHETEARVHRRMFRPYDTLPGELPVPNDLWLQMVDITLTPLTEFSERTDLYSSDGGADGLLVPELWRAVSALYSTNVFFGMLGDTDYQVNGQADFVVIEDLTKDVGDAGKFLLFIWEELGSPSEPTASSSTRSQATWGALKQLFL